MSSNSLRIHIRRTHRNFNDLSAVNKSNSNVNETKNNVASENSYLDSKNESDSIITSNNTHHFINEYFLRHAENEIDLNQSRKQGSDSSAGVKDIAKLYLDLSANDCATKAILQPMIAR